MRKIINPVIKVIQVVSFFCFLFSALGLFFSSSAANAGQNIYYEPTVKRIIRNDCGRCHSGPTRYFMDYDSLKSYAQSGLLAGMVQGPMKRFAGNNAQIILDWIDQGAREKPDANTAQKANFTAPPGANCPTPQGGASRGGTGHQPLHQGRNQTTAVKTAPPGVNCPAPQGALPGGGTGHQPLHQGRNRTVTGGITYNNTIQYVLKQDCLRCHSGKFRNLATYNNVKMYADNGLLKELVRLGGPMHRFAGPDTRLIIQWVNEGAPQ